MPIQPTHKLGVADSLSPDASMEENQDWFNIWQIGLHDDNSEKRWSGLLGMINSAQTYVEEEQLLQPLLELAFWEAAETLSLGHPRKQFVMNLFLTLSTWEGYLQVTKTFIWLFIRCWIDMLSQRSGMTARVENLTVQRERIRAMRSSDTTKATPSKSDLQ